jgi:hypothetical protein
MTFNCSPVFARSKFFYETKKDGATLTLEDVQGTCKPYTVKKCFVHTAQHTVHVCCFVELSIVYFL